MENKRQHYNPREGQIGLHTLCAEQPLLVRRAGRYCLVNASLVSDAIGSVISIKGFLPKNIPYTRR